MSTPKTFLQLAKDLRREVGANGTGPSSVLNQIGEYERIVNYIIEADEEIQLERGEWKFMTRQFALNTVVGQMAYTGANFLTPASDVSKWKPRTIKCYQLSAGKGAEYFLHYLDYQDWDALYNTGTLTNNPPGHWSIGNANELLIGGPPGDVYRITGEYFRTPVTLAADADLPLYPAEFHRLPIYLGMMKYGRFTGAAEVYSDGERLYNKLLLRMIRTQLPQWNANIPLA